jgi:hypothetical protein
MCFALKKSINKIKMRDDWIQKSRVFIFDYKILTKNSIQMELLEIKVNEN